MKQKQYILLQRKVYINYLNKSKYFHYLIDESKIKLKVLSGQLRIQFPKSSLLIKTPKAPVCDIVYNLDKVLGIHRFDSDETAKLWFKLNY